MQEFTKKWIRSNGTVVCLYFKKFKNTKPLHQENKEEISNCWSQWTRLRSSCQDGLCGVEVRSNRREHKAPLKDIDVIPIKNVFMGPLKGIYCKNGKWEFPQYLNVKKVFEKTRNVERDIIYNTYICNKYL